MAWPIPTEEHSEGTFAERGHRGSHTLIISRSPKSDEDLVLLDLETGLACPGRIGSRTPPMDHAGRPWHGSHGRQDQIGARATRSGWCDMDSLGARRAFEPDPPLVASNQINNTFVIRGCAIRRCRSASSQASQAGSFTGSCAERAGQHA